MAIGSIIAYTGATVPSRFLVCDGSAVSRDTYSDLFSVIGTLYGSGDGSTTFNLPDLVDRTLIGLSLTHSLSSTGGTEDVTLTTSEVAEHSHTVPSHGHGNSIKATTPSLSHTITQAVFKYTHLNGTAGDAHSGGSQFYNGTTSASMSRSANLAVSAHSATACKMSGSVTDCAAFDSENTGGDGAHNNMMPFMALTWIIEAEPDIPPGPKMYLFNGALPVSAGGAYICGKTR